MLFGMMTVLDIDCVDLMSMWAKISNVTSEEMEDPLGGEGRGVWFGLVFEED